jgi:hypothetical protein
MNNLFKPPSRDRRRRQLSALGLVTLVLLSGSQVTRAARGLVDQANEVFTSRASRNIGNLAPIGQEFKPQQRKLNMVELFLDDAACTRDGGSGAEVQVRIRRATIDGPVLAESPAVAFPNCFDGIIRFEFHKDVRVTAGSTHVLEVVAVAGQANVFGNDRGSTYPRGRQVIQGVPHEDKDLWFRVGRVSPEDRWWQ